MANYTALADALETKILDAITSGKAMIQTVQQGDGSVIQYMSLPSAVLALKDLRALARTEASTTDTDYRPIRISPAGVNRV